jgi:phage baseplate assembly protein W
MSTLGPTADWDDYPQVGVGWGFPVQWDDGGLRASAGKERIEEALLVLVRTGVGERVMLPSFGAGVDRFVFEQRTDEVCRRLEDDVRRTLLLHEPRVIVDRIEAVPAGADDRIDVLLEYRIDRHRRPESLVLPFYAAGRP